MTEILSRTIRSLLRKAVHLWLHNRESDSLSLCFTQDDLASGEMRGKQVRVEIRYLEVSDE